MSVPQDRKPKPNAAPASPQGVTVTVAANDSAPFLYCDGAGAFGCVNGIVQLELAANSLVAIERGGKPDVRSRLVAVAHLRCSIEAAKNLRETIDQALAMAMPKPAAAQPKTPTSSKFANSKPGGPKPLAPQAPVVEKVEG